MKRLKIFLWLFISNLLFASEISYISTDETTYSPGENVVIDYRITDNLKYKLRFRAFDKDGNALSAANFSASILGKTNYIIPNDYNFNTLKIVLELIEPNGNVADRKELSLNINLNTCDPEYELVQGDDNYGTVNLPFSFHGYTVMYPNTNGYITFNSGETSYHDYVRAYNPMIWTTNQDLMTYVYVTKCTNYVKIRWEGGYYPNWSGSYSAWVKINRDGSIEQSDGGYYGF